MIGQVDFKKSMDFWQEDKWNGFFPVKWHIIKDISHREFQHIIVEDNDHKAVTHSRDTQEVFSWFTHIHFTYLHPTICNGCLTGNRWINFPFFLLPTMGTWSHTLSHIHLTNQLSNSWGFHWFYSVMFLCCLCFGGKKCSGDWLLIKKIMGIVNWWPTIHHCRYHYGHHLDFIPLFGVVFSSYSSYWFIYGYSYLLLLRNLKCSASMVPEHLN